MQNPKAIRALLKQTRLPFCSVNNFEKINTNESKGFQKTVVRTRDVEEADLFWKLLPPEIKTRLPLLKK